MNQEDFMSKDDKNILRLRLINLVLNCKDPKVIKQILVILNRRTNPGKDIQKDNILEKCKKQWDEETIDPAWTQ